MRYVPPAERETHVLRCDRSDAGSSSIPRRRCATSSCCISLISATAISVPKCRCMSRRRSRKSSLLRLAIMSSRPHKTDANSTCGLSADLADCFSRSWCAISRSCIMMMVRPRTVTELSGPYLSLCLSQCRNSSSSCEGKSKMFPMNGRGLGPGGNKVVSLRREKFP